MKEQIYTIPINESFEQKDGCPVCRLARDLEQSSLEYVLGAAMMEPDIRIATNNAGFCHRHYDKMLGMKNRLSLALMLESHLPELEKRLPRSDSKRTSESMASKLKNESESCYLCNRASGFMVHYYKNIIYLWKVDPLFREKLVSQPYICLKHHSALLDYGGKGLSKDDYAELFSALDTLNRGFLDSLKKDISLFCKSFDHRFSGMELGEAKNSVERAALFLTGNGSL